MNDEERAAVALAGPTAAAAASLTRRDVLRHGAIGGIATAMSIPFAGRLLSPVQAHAQGVPLSILTADQAATLQAFGDVLLPGASKAGLAEFLDHQLSKEIPLLMIRYFDWPGPLLTFYTGGLAALDAATVIQFGTTFGKAANAWKQAITGSLLGGNVKGWNGPPSSLFYLAVRGDAVDVVYGTSDGFAKLNVPYMPHILPKETW